MRQILETHCEPNVVSPNTELLTEEWERVRHWPDEQRRELLSRLMWSLKPADATDIRSDSPAQLIGAWAIPSPPSDEEVARILDEERAKGCG